MTTTTMFAVRIRIPEGVRFADLRLARARDGVLSYDEATIERVCVASGLDPHTVLANEDIVGALLITWHERACEGGEPADPVMADLIAEARAEDERGDGLSHPAGRA